MKKKIALFGVSGQTGQKFLHVAINQGYEIKTLVCDKTKLTNGSPKLSVLEGDVLKEADANMGIEGADIVVSLFGHVKGSPD